MKKSKIVAIGVIVAGAFVLGLLAKGFHLSPEAKVAEISIHGIIAPGAHASPSTVYDQVQKAKDEDVQAYLFQVNSPGGTAVSSRQLHRVIENLEKPTVCQFQDVAASGAYWASSACDYIVSDSLTITGSIGVSASYLEYSEYMQEEGIDYVRLVKGKLKDMGSPYRNLTEKEREIFNHSLQKVYNEFIQGVASSRGLNESKVRSFATGRTFLGSKAKEKGLVDYLGGEREAKKILENVLGKEVQLKSYEEKVNLLDLMGVSKEDGDYRSRAEKFIHSLEGRAPSLLALYR